MSAAGEYLSTRWCKKKKRKWKAFSEQSTSCCTVVLVILVRTIFVGCTLGGRYAFLAAQFHVTLPSSAANSARSESGTRRSSRVFAMESTSTRLLHNARPPARPDCSLPCGEMVGHQMHLAISPFVNSSGSDYWVYIATRHNNSNASKFLFDGNRDTIVSWLTTSLIFKK